MPIGTPKLHVLKRWSRQALAAAALLALAGCVVAPGGGYYGAAPAYPAYAAEYPAYPSYPSYGYYPAPAVGVVVGGGWGRHGGWNRWR